MTTSTRDIRFATMMKDLITSDSVIKDGLYGALFDGEKGERDNPYHKTLEEREYSRYGTGLILGDILSVCFMEFGWRSVREPEEE